MTSLDLSSFTNEKLLFLNANERNVDPEVAEVFRAVAQKDLTLFLKLRAEELVDDGYGLYLMVSDQCKGRSDSNFTRTAPRFK